MDSAQVQTVCPKCRKRLRVSVQLTGELVRCPECQTNFVVTNIAFRQWKEPSQGKDLGNANDEHLRGEPGGSKSSFNEASAARLISNGTSDQIASAGTKPSGSGQAGQLGRFELYEILGSGGFGIVYRARDPLLNRQIAIKTPRFAVTDKAKAKRFLNEAKAASRLRHPNIVAAFEGGEADGRLYLAAEFVNGETLAQRIRKTRPSFQQSATWISELARALAYAHRQGVIHRDIKPQNVMISSSGRPQIMDFGLAKRISEDSGMTVDGTLLGTPAYMSPEQAQGKVTEIGPQSDQYSLGAVFYELLTGQKPFDGPPSVAIAKAATMEPAQPRKINPDIPIDLEAICLKAMDREISRRYADAAELAADLSRWEEGEMIIARPLPTTERMRRWIRRDPVDAGLIIAVSVLMLLAASLIAAGVVRMIRSGRELDLAVKTAQDRAQKAVAEAKRATAARENAIRNTAMADVAAQRASMNRESNAMAIAKLKAEVDERTRIDNEIISASEEAEKFAELARHSQSRKQDREILAAGVQLAIDRAMWDQYADQLAKVRTLLSNGEFENASRLLMTCDGRLRGWEWMLLESRAIRRISDVSPQVIQIPLAINRTFRSAGLLGVSADGLLIAIHQTSFAGRRRCDELHVLSLQETISPQLLQTFDLIKHDIGTLACFSRDNRAVCLSSPKPGQVLRCRLDAQRRFDIEQVSVEESSGPSTGGKIRSVFDAYNETLADDTAHVYVSVDGLKGGENDRAFTIDAAGVFAVRQKNLSRPLLAMSLKELLESRETGSSADLPAVAQVCWSEDNRRLIIAVNSRRPVLLLFDCMLRE